MLTSFEMVGLIPATQVSVAGLRMWSGVLTLRLILGEGTAHA